MSPLENQKIINNARERKLKEKVEAQKVRNKDANTLLNTKRTSESQKIFYHILEN